MSTVDLYCNQCPTHPSNSCIHIHNLTNSLNTTRTTNSPLLATTLTHCLHSCWSVLPLPLHAGQPRGNINMLALLLLLLPPPAPLLLLLVLLKLLVLPASGLHVRTIISPLPLHTLQSAVWEEASKPDPCSSISSTAIADNWQAAAMSFSHVHIKFA